LKKQTVTIRAG